MFFAPRRALTLIELLTVFAIVGIVSALTLAAVQRVRETANRARCANNLRQIGLALHNYHDAKKSLPPGVSDNEGKADFPFMGWQTRLLPFIEQSGLWWTAIDAFQKDRDFLHDPPHTGLSTVVVLYACPADARTLDPQVVDLRTLRRSIAFTSYLGVEGINQYEQDGVLFLDSRIRFADIRDGLSATLMVGERPPSADGVLGWWYAGWGQEKDGSGDMVLGVRERNNKSYGPNCPMGPYHFRPGNFKNQCDAFHFWSPHPGGGHFLFADGSTRFLAYRADSLLPALATRDGGEIGNLTD